MSLAVPLSAARRTAILFLVAGAMFMENLDGTVITTAVPEMARSFGVAPLSLNIGISAYLLTLGVFIPISGWMADRFGARRVFAVAIFLFTLASLLCGRAESLTSFVLLRVLQGIGGAMMVPVGRYVVLRETPRDKLMGALALLTWPALAAPVMGPVVGGFITTYFSWRWIFYLNVPLGLIAMAAVWLLLPKDPPGEKRPFDWPGFLFMGGAFFSILLAAETLGQREAEPLVAGVIALAGGLLLGLGMRHLRRVEHPMLALDALKMKTFAVSIYGGSLFRMSVAAVPFVLPLMLQIGFGLDPFQAGLLLMAVFAGNFAMKAGSTQLLRRFGFRRMLLISGSANVVALAACALFTPETPVPVMVAILFFGGLTRSMQFSTLNLVAFADVPPQRMSAANALFSTVFQTAMGLGIALGAISIRFGDLLVHGLGLDHVPAAGYRAAFLIIACVALCAMWDAVRLPASAGDAMRKGHGPTDPPAKQAAE